MGSGNRVAMADLRTLVEGLGYEQVRSHINSGNLLFHSPDPDDQVVAALSAAILGQLGLKIDVTVRDRDRLRAIVAGNPFPHGDPSRVTVAFLTGPPAAGAEARVAAVAPEHEPFSFAGTEIWVNYTEGMAGSRLAAQFSKIIGVSATVRNLRTTERVLTLLSG